MLPFFLVRKPFIKKFDYSVEAKTDFGPWVGRCALAVESKVVALLILIYNNASVFIFFIREKNIPTSNLQLNRVFGWRSIVYNGIEEIVGRKLFASAKKKRMIRLVFVKSCRSCCQCRCQWFRIFKFREMFGDSNTA